MTQGKNNTGQPSLNRKRRLQRWLPLVVLVVLMGLAFSQGWHRQVSVSALIMHREGLLNIYASYPVLVLLSYAAFYILATALSIPGGAVLTIASGFLFGWFIGGAITVGAATLGAIAVFVIAKSSLGAELREKAGPMLSKMAAGFRHNATSYMLFLRLCPIFPFWLVNIAPALFSISLFRYAWTTALGIIPGTFAFAFVGSGLESLVMAQEAANPGCAAAATCSLELSALITPRILIALTALAVVALIPSILRQLGWFAQGGHAANAPKISGKQKSSSAKLGEDD
ncbi:TVP38/TMEM64 family protein [Polycladidibacter hongkongensis]|uniref:TVP38/TMEM64 family protein n=1 Tax=Polycladidibacter hongkongensis TaxID=1647556 RepID=UPI0009EA6AD5|nr:TVP38/TMEM64 family protein [Pseudovibrio hongkongensis]